MIKKSNLVFFVMSLSAPALLHAQSVTTEPLDGIVAIVDESVILQSELNSAVRGIESQFQGRTDLPPRDILQKQVIERLINARLQTDRASSTGIRVSDTELEKAIENVAAGSQITREQLRESLARDGIEYEAFRNTIRDQLLVQRLQQRYVMSRVQVTETEIDLELANPNRIKGEVRLSHILIGLPDGATPEQIQTAREKGEKVRAEIVNGIEFSAAAIRYSDGPQALEGGDLGWRRAEQVPNAFSDALSGLQTGELSQVMRGPSGFHLIKLTDKRESAPVVVQEVNTRHIVAKIDEITSAEDAKEKIDSLRARAVAGEDFGKLAKAESQDPNTASAGGDMGWFEKNAFGPEIGTLISGLAENEISEPFRTELGYHVLQRLGSRDRDRTADYEREQARDTIRKRRAEEEYENFVRQMRAEAYIENRLAQSAPTKN